MKKTHRKKNIKPYNRYKPGSARYYKDQLENIHDVCIDYDGYNIDNAESMRMLIDDLKEMASDALNHKHLYVRLK